MRHSGRVAVLALVCLSPLPLQANEARQHDGGFFMRLAPGFGSSRTQIDIGETFGGTAEVKGLSGSFEAALGVGVAHNLVLHATLGAWSMVDPQFEIGGTEFPTSDLTMTLAYFGVGVTYYLGDSNVFLTGSLCGADLSAELDNETTNTDIGLAVEAAVGKEWWLSDTWALGVAGVVNYHSVPDADIDEKWSGTSFGVRLTLSMN